jgi:hypothetical protein
MEYISMVVSEEPLGFSSEDWVRPGVEGEIDGDEGAGFGSKGLGGTTRRFGVSIKRGGSTPYK